MGESIPVLGKIRMHVKGEGQEEVLPVLVVKGAGPNLMGREWLNKIKANFWEVYSLTNQHSFEELLEKHSVVFKEKLSCLQDIRTIDGRGVRTKTRHFKLLKKHCNLIPY